MTILTKEQDSNVSGVSKDEKEKERLVKNEILSVFEDMGLDETRCNLACFSPKWAQRFARKKLYLIAYCIVGLFIGAYFTYTVSTISTIEKRFKLTSKYTGIMLAGNDISQVILSIVVSYFGNYGNRPKWIGLGVLCASVTCLISALPHWLYGIGEDAQLIIDAMDNSSFSSRTLWTANNFTKSKTADYCEDPFVDNCDSEHQGAYLGAVAIFFLGQFFLGITVTVFYSVGFVYLDDNVRKEDTPLYYAISLIIRTIGPVAGFFLGSQALRLYIDPSFRPNLSLKDPRWLGAWWLGYIILAVVLFLGGIIILLFPKTLPTTFYKKVKKAFESENKGQTLSTKTDIRYYIELAKKSNNHVKPSMKKLPAALKRIMTNKIWLGNTFNTVLYLFALIGYWNFKPKYLEFQFRQSASLANFYTGVASLLASVMGIGISGIFIKCYKPSPRLIAGYAIILTLFSTVTMISLMLIKCPQIDVKGPMSWSPELGDCNVSCDCGNRYSPVCSEDGQTLYYSSCYAGCTTIDESANPIKYGNCRCVKSKEDNSFPYNATDISSNQFSVEPSMGGEAIQGYCPSDCDAFTNYILVTVITKLIDATGRVGGTVLYLRSVEDHDKGLALGLSTGFLSLFAFIPAPIVMGAIVDSACMIWDNKCGKQGNCWLYDSEKFRILMHIVPAVIILFSVIGDIIVFRNCKDVQMYEEDTKNATKTDDAANFKELEHLDAVKISGSDT